MSSNKNIHNELARIYGNKCMFLATHSDNAHYKKYTKRYKSKELRRLIRRITVHHLQHRSENGSTTIENCSLVSELAHRYIHTLPRDEEEIINNRIRHYKKCKVEFVDDLDTEIDLHYGLLQDGKVKEVNSISRNERLDRDRRKSKKEFERTRKEWEDR